MDRHTSTKSNCDEGVKKLNLGWSKYKCTCHVYGQTHKYKQTKTVMKVSKTKPWLVEVQVHLSRLWTDTQVQTKQRIRQSEK